MAKNLCSTCKFLFKDNNVGYYECSKEDLMTDAQYIEYEDTGTIKNCPFYEEDFSNFIEFDEDFDLDDIIEEGPRYTVSYEGYLFVGDKENEWNSHDYDRWDDVQKLLNNYEDMNIIVKDNYYNVTYEDGEWY